jgi:hypothetical protein
MAPLLLYATEPLVTFWSHAVVPVPSADHPVCPSVYAMYHQTYPPEETLPLVIWPSCPLLSVETMVPVVDGVARQFREVATTWT